MVQLAVFVTLIAAAGLASWFARRAAVPLAFAVFFAVDGAVETMRHVYGGHASLSAAAAIALCAVAWIVDRISPEG